MAWSPPGRSCSSSQASQASAPPRTGTPSTSSCGTPASFSSPLALVAKRRAISSWSAARTLTQKRPDARTAERVRAAVERDENERWVERERRERVRRSAAGPLVAARHDSDAGRPVGHQAAQLCASIMPRDRRTRRSARLGRGRARASTSSSSARAGGRGRRRTPRRRRLEVAIVEEHLVGGECSYYACMPSKALLRPGELLAEAGACPGVRAAASTSAAVLGARRGDPRPRRLGADALARGARRHARSRPRAARRREARRVGDDELVARPAVVVATGKWATMPPITGSRGASWENREATTAKKDPQSLVILGGGVVGVELAQAWASLGTQVTVGVEGLSTLDLRARSRSRASTSRRRAGSWASTSAGAAGRSGVFAGTVT